MSSTSTSSIQPHRLPPWPPSITDSQLDYLSLLSSSWALAHGFVLLPPFNPHSQHPPAPAHKQGIPAPLALFPTPFPRDLFQEAREIQWLYNALYARIALDWDFLDGVYAESIAKVDAFQGALWSGWKRIREEIVQPLQLGIFRSDYLLHAGSPEHPQKPELKQVEFNTIASSFGALSQRADEMHRYMAEETNMYYNSSPLLSDPANYPINSSLVEIAAGLADGWRAYGKNDAVVLFVVQENERNVFDQRLLQYELLEKHGVRTVRHTFAELAQLAQIDYNSKRLMLPSLLQPHADPREVAVIYYRAAYTPNDYPTNDEWGTRLLLERSRAIKCPSMALQLAGAKKVQQVLTEPGVLEDFLLGPERPDVGFGEGAGRVTRADIEKLRKTWIGLWPMDDSPLGRQAHQMAMEEPNRFVLKPQREGGGNNIYRTDIPPYLDNLERQARKQGDPAAKEGYILMELIEPPREVHNWLVKGGEGLPGRKDVVSELGVYGVMLFGADPRRAVNREAGFLLRTKGRESDEGGVAVGVSSIDSPILVDWQ